MKHLLVGLSTLFLLASTGCETHQTMSTHLVVSRSIDSQSASKKLQEKLSTTKAAANAGDFIIARQEFNEVENLWNVVETTLKAKSYNDYLIVAGNIKKVDTALHAVPLSRERAVLSLRSLEKSLENTTLV